MTSQLEIDPDPDRPFGWARLVIRGAVRASDTRFRLRRLDGDPSEMGPHGWQNGPTDLTAVSVRVAGQDLILEVGPEIVNHIVIDTRVEVELPAIGLAASAFWPDIPPSARPQAPYVVMPGARVPVAPPPPEPPPAAPRPPLLEPPSSAPPVSAPLPQASPAQPMLKFTVGTPINPDAGRVPIGAWLVALSVLIVLAVMGLWLLELYCMGPGLFAPSTCSMAKPSPDSLPPPSEPPLRPSPPPPPPLPPPAEISPPPSPPTPLPPTSSTPPSESLPPAPSSHLPPPPPEPQPLPPRPSPVKPAPPPIPRREPTLTPVLMGQRQLKSSEATFSDEGCAARPLPHFRLDELEVDPRRLRQDGRLLYRITYVFCADSDHATALPRITANVLQTGRLIAQEAKAYFSKPGTWEDNREMLLSAGLTDGSYTLNITVLSDGAISKLSADFQLR